EAASAERRAASTEASSCLRDSKERTFTSESDNDGPSLPQVWNHAFAKIVQQLIELLLGPDRPTRPVNFDAARRQFAGGEQTGPLDTARDDLDPFDPGCQR